MNSRNKGICAVVLGLLAPVIGSGCNMEILGKRVTGSSKPETYIHGKGYGLGDTQLESGVHIPILKVKY